MSEHDRVSRESTLTIEVNQSCQLSRQEQQRLTELLEHCVKPAAIAIDALVTIQQSRGWISDQTLSAIGSFIGVSTAELDSVATFYNLIFRQPVATTVLHPCNGMACKLMGSDIIERKISSCLGISAGQTDSENRFTMIPLPCLGACDKAPVMIADKTLFELITADKVSDILAQLADKRPSS